MTSGPLANSNNSRSANIGADPRRSSQLDARAVDTVSRVGSEPEGLRAAPTGKKREDREDKDYVIDAVAKALKVFEALEGRNFEPVNTARVVERTGLSRDICHRSLKTLKVCGYARETLDGWILGPKAESLARRVSASLLKGQ